MIGGSQGARILSDVVPIALCQLPEPLRQSIQVSHQARPEDRERVLSIYVQAGVPARVEPFFKDLPARMADAQLVIARSGAATVAELTALGRPSILIPLPTATADHQTANAAPLEAAGAATMLPEAGLTAEALRDRVAALLSDPEALTAMATAARGLGVPDATEKLTALVLRYAKS